MNELRVLGGMKERWVKGFSCDMAKFKEWKIVGLVKWYKGKVYGK